MAFSALTKFSQKATSLFQGAPEFTVIHDRVMTMPQPTTDGGRNDVLAVADALKSQYGEHFMVWNLSEKPYDYDLFENQVLEFKFPGYPCPPLGVLIQLIKSIRSWLAADPINVAIVHCATGHVRTATVLACHLAFCGTFQNVTAAMEHYYHVMKLDAGRVTIPSQLRYIAYFGETLSGFDPKDISLTLQCIVANDMPMLTQTAPSIQIFENSKLVYTSPKGSADILGNGTVSFPVNHTISGDVLIRSRQPLGPIVPGVRPAMTSIFRINIHTAFVTTELMRLPKAALDGPHREESWPESMFVDLIFEDMTANKCPVDTQEAEAAPSVWQIARNEQIQQEDDLAPQPEEPYQPYAPYKSRNDSMTEEMIEDEIARAELSDAEDDAKYGAMSNAEMIQAVDELPSASPAHKNTMSLSNLSIGVEPVCSPVEIKSEQTSSESAQDELEAQICAALQDADLADEDDTGLCDDDLLADLIADENLNLDEADEMNLEDEEAWMAELEAELGRED